MKRNGIGDEMSTRGLLGFRLENKDYLTYNHFDSYPSGLGARVAEFVVNNKDNLNDIIVKVKKLQLVAEEDTPTEEQKKYCKLKEVCDLSVSSRSDNDWYCLLRKAQGDLERILDVGIMINSQDFIKDSLYCEWAYTINFDTMMLEIWHGFQEKPNQNNRYGAENNYKKIFTGDKEIHYYPCDMLEQIPLDDEHIVEKVSNLV